MKNKRQKLTLLLLAVSASITLLNACTTKNSEDSLSQEVVNESTAGESSLENNGVIYGKFRAADMGFIPQEIYDYPYIGLSYTIPESLTRKMDEKSVIMLADEVSKGEHEAVGYAQFTWSAMDEVQRETEVDPMSTEPDDWIESLVRIGTLGIYHSEMIDKLDELTGCTEHTEIGQSADAAYKYFLSVNPNADSGLVADIKQIETQLSEMLPYNGMSAFDIFKPDFTGSNIGEFETTDIHGNKYSEDIFSENDLTLVNIFTTWCTPCVEEIPHLQELSKNMSAQNLGVIGIVMDTVNSDGSHNEEAIKKSKILEERSAAKYPFLMPDRTNMNGRLDYVDAYPETFFVDRDGNIVGEVYLGGRDLSEWTKIVEKELANIKEPK